VRLAELLRPRRVQREIYDQMTYEDANSSPSPRSSTTRSVRLSRAFQGLQGLRLPCRMGVFSGRAHAAADYLSRRSCSHRAPLQQRDGAVAVQTAWWPQSIRELVSPAGGCTSRAAHLAATRDSRFLRLQPPGGRCSLHRRGQPRAAGFRRSAFALDLLEQPARAGRSGVSFNVPYRNHFRVTTLPDAVMLRDVFRRIDELLTEYASAPREPAAATSSRRPLASSKYLKYRNTLF